MLDAPCEHRNVTKVIDKETSKSLFVCPDCLKEWPTGLSELGKIYNEIMKGTK